MTSQMTRNILPISHRGKAYAACRSPRPCPKVTAAPRSRTIVAPLPVTSRAPGITTETATTATRGTSGSGTASVSPCAPGVRACAPLVRGEPTAQEGPSAGTVFVSRATLGGRSYKLPLLVGASGLVALDPCSCYRGRTNRPVTTVQRGRLARGGLVSLPFTSWLLLPIQAASLILPSCDVSRGGIEARIYVACVVMPLVVDVWPPPGCMPALR
jgi:hypothetical protein